MAPLAVSSVGLRAMVAVSVAAVVAAVVVVGAGVVVMALLVVTLAVAVTGVVALMAAVSVSGAVVDALSVCKTGVVGAGASAKLLLQAANRMGTRNAMMIKGEGLIGIMRPFIDRPNTVYAGSFIVAPLLWPA